METATKRKNYKHLNFKLKDSEITNMKNAFINSMYENCPLNRHIVVNTEALTDTKSYQNIFKSIRDLYTKFAKFKGFKPAFVTVVEEAPYTGLHLHILVHVPKNGSNPLIFPVKKRLRKLILNNSNKLKLDGSDVHIRSISYGKYLNRHDYYGKIIEVTDQIVKQQMKLMDIELASYRSTKFDDTNWYLHDDTDLLRIFNYLCKGIAAHSEGSFYARRFTCSHWLKTSPKPLGSYSLRSTFPDEMAKLKKFEKITDHKVLRH